MGLAQGTIIGNLTRDPELRYTPQGKAVCSFTVACNTGYGEYKKVLYMPVVVWGKRGEAAAHALLKGSQCAVVGNLEERSWEADGQTKKKLELIATDVQFLSFYQKGVGGDAPPQEVSDIEPF